MEEITSQTKKSGSRPHPSMRECGVLTWASMWATIPRAGGQATQELRATRPRTWRENNPSNRAAFTPLACGSVTSLRMRHVGDHPKNWRASIPRTAGLKMLGRPPQALELLDRGGGPSILIRTTRPNQKKYLTTRPPLSRGDTTSSRFVFICAQGSGLARKSSAPLKHFRKSNTRKHLHPSDSDGCRLFPCTYRIQRFASSHHAQII